MENVPLMSAGTVKRGQVSMLIVTAFIYNTKLSARELPVFTTSFSFTRVCVAQRSLNEIIETKPKPKLNKSKQARMRMVPLSNLHWKASRSCPYETLLHFSGSPLSKCQGVQSQELGQCASRDFRRQSANRPHQQVLGSHVT